MKRLLCALALGCTGPRDTASPGVSARVDEEFGTLVFVSWEQAEAATVSVAYRVAGEGWRATPARTLEAGLHEQVLLGLPYGIAVEYEVRAEGVEEPLGFGGIETGAVPGGLPEVTILASEPALQDPGMAFVLGSVDELNDAGTSEATWVFLLDRQGRYVWARRTEDFRASLQPHLARDGRALLIDLDSFWAVFDEGERSQVERVTLDGTIEEVWDTPGLHHPFVETDPGTIAWGAWNGGLETLEEVTAAGARRTLWRCADFHAAAGVPGAQCSSNTLNFDPATDRFLFSFYTTNTVVEIDRAGGTERRWFGEVPGAWSFTPKESQFYWQHGAHYTADGTLLVSARASEDASVTVVREYALDEAGETLDQVWSYGQDEGLYARQLGDAWRLPGGNTLHNLGSLVRLREVTPEREVAWDLTWSPASVLLRTEPLADLYTLAPGGTP